MNWIRTKIRDMRGWIWGIEYWRIDDAFWWAKEQAKIDKRRAELLAEKAEIIKLRDQIEKQYGLDK